MAKEDEEKTAFITSQGIFCYTKMPFGLRNAGATYQRLVDKAFHKQIGRNLEVYVDDLVIKSRTEDEIVRDMEETFQTLREINMKLNPKKCTFGIEEGMFLGYKVSTRGLKVCPDKVDVVLSLPSPKCLKDVHKLNGKLASLNRFLAKSVEKSLPFFKTLKKCTKKSDFCWTVEAEEAFKQMKQLIAELPMLVTPTEKEELIVYLAAAKETGLMVWNINTLDGKLVVGLGHASKLLKRYFQAHPIIVITDQLIQQVLSIPEVADFIVKRPEEDSPDTLMEEAEELPKPWILFTDGSSCTDGSRAGLILTNPKGMEFSYALRFRFDATNNEEEYEALIAGATNVLAVVEEEGDTWMTPIFKYLTNETLPAEARKARAVRRKSWWFSIINGTLYKKSFLGPWLWCIGPLQANYDARMLIRACQDCQVHKHVPGISKQKETLFSDIEKAVPGQSFKDCCEKTMHPQHFALLNIRKTIGLLEEAKLLSWR
ncbi:reverse transcriptase domain-containing protein [Tanacetum coccineum]